MSKQLWEPSAQRIKNSQLQKFTDFVRDSREVEFVDYEALHQWSVKHAEDFWQSVWDYADIKSSVIADTVLQDKDKFPGAKWFPGSRLNFAENLLRYRDNRVALVCRLENGERKSLTYAELYGQVEQLASALKSEGVVVGDRIAGFMPNVIETVVAMLAATSLGAVWSSCSPDFGLNGVKDRFGQIQPKVLFACNGYFYNGKIIDTRLRVLDVCNEIESIQKVVMVPVVDEEKFSDEIQIPHRVDWSHFLHPEPEALSFAQLPFDHPLYIMYSSGTTGVPKCIVHSAGGTLVQQVKEQLLHVGLTREDKLFYFTTCGWMMWNWLVSGLAVGATLILYDGSPFYPEAKSLMDMADEESISIFGTSAKYIAGLEKAEVKPVESHKLTDLKTILSTGSPLSPESFDYVYRDIKADICLSSISGGTDIVSCFTLGNETLPVYEGELQCKGLGMAIEIWSDSSEKVVAEKGELVCTQTFPSCPIGFWNDPGDLKFRAAYFDVYPNIWVHGDYGEETDHGGIIIHGRSDAVLNPGGVRIGTAEIYRQVEKLPEIVDSICIGQQWQDDVRVVLFVVLREGVDLTVELQQRIRKTIRSETTPRHVPAKILTVTDIPRTISGKIVELAVRNMVHNQPVKNTDALANPEALEQFSERVELQN